MIYLAAIALFLTVGAFFRKARQNGWRTTALDSLFAAFAGLGAGIFIGFGARTGMWAIAFFNGDASRFSVSGSLQVILLFSSFGIGLGLLYEILLRDLLRQSGVLFGIIITLCTWYPFAESAADLLRFQPTIVSLVFFTGIFTAFMWLPFAVTLERLLEVYQNKLKKPLLSGGIFKRGETRL
jgi:hypothetical protein